MNSAWPVVLLFVLPVLGAEEAARTLVKVNGTAITAADVEFAFTTKQIPSEDRAQRQPQLIEELIDRQIVRDFLTKRKITAPPEELAYQIQLAENTIKRGGEDPGKVLPKLGYTPDRLKAELGLPLAWQVYARQTITLPETKAYFDQHRSELDGTQLRARQIFLKLPSSASEAEIAAKTSQLKDIKSQITAGKLDFAEAARKYSDAPSKEQGGDVGTFGVRGKLPTPVIRAAFELKLNEISEPVPSLFGLHLLQVTQRIPGDLSLEDVRPQILERLSDQLWKDTLDRERKTARIEWVK